MLPTGACVMPAVRANPRARSFARHAKDRAVGVVAHEQRAVAGDGHAGRPAPDGVVVHQEPGHEVFVLAGRLAVLHAQDRKSTRLNSSHMSISYAVFCLKKKKT